jgi:hypothetical protein
MATRVDDVLQELAADLSKDGFDVQRVNRAAAQIQALPVETEDDRRLVMAGYLRLIDTTLPQAPSDIATSLESQRQQIQARFEQMYGRADSPYAATVRITAKLAEDLKQGRPAEELEASAMAELAALPFDQSLTSLFVNSGKVRTVTPPLRRR